MVTMRLPLVASIGILQLAVGLEQERLACADTPALSEQAMARLPGFGDPGQFAVSSDFGMSVGPLTQKFPHTPVTSFTMKPGVDVFILRHISLGCEFLYDTQDTQTFVYSPPFTSSSSITVTRTPFVDTTRTTYGAALRAGVQVPVRGVVSLWPRMSVGVWTANVHFAPRVQASLDPNAPYNYDYGETALYGSVSIPLLVHIVPHFFVGIGFDVRADLSSHPVRDFGRGQLGVNGSSRTSIHGSSTLGGWF
jgi:hypothetical protein